MQILFLGPIASPMLSYLESVEDKVIATMEPIDAKFLQVHAPDFIVSYGYRHILKKDVLARYPNRAINLHVSFLPWNRGADPNFWSFVEDTPKGVTIHYLDEGIDTGDIIIQKKVTFISNETLETSYDKLQEEIQELFREHWPQIRLGRCPRIKQEGLGSFHYSKDKNTLTHLLIQRWDTPVAVLESYTAETQMTVQFWEQYESEIEAMQKHSTNDPNEK